MSFIVTIALFLDPNQTREETVTARDAISAMKLAEQKNPNWISVEAVAA
jgi:hypothetical protein